MDNVNGIVRHLAQLIRGTLPLPVWYGRGQFGADDELFRRTQIGLASNPNIASVLVDQPGIGLGAEGRRRHRQDRQAGRDFSVQEAGGTVEAISRGMRLLLPMVKAASAMRPEDVPLVRTDAGRGVWRH